MLHALNNNILVNLNKPVDARVGPWSSVAQALERVPLHQRYKGLTVQVHEEGVVNEYWFKEGTADEHLILKTTNVNPGELPTLELQVDEGKIQWRVVGDPDWTDLIELSELEGSDGEKGDTGDNVELRIFGGYVQWKAEGDEEWNNLLSVDSLRGEDGEDGTSVKILGSVATATALPGWPDAYDGDIGDGYLTSDTGHLWVWSGTGWVDAGSIRGPKGDDGTEVELGTGGGFIRWRYVDQDVWTNLVSLESLKGEQGIQGVKGDKGDQGEQGIQGVQGLQGVKGDQGEQGEKGDQGEPGVQGVQGIQGVKGDKGDTGDDGADGRDGRSVELRVGQDALQEVYYYDFIQWRWQGQNPPDSWKNLISLGDLRGKGLEFNWDGTKLGVRKEGDEDYEYTELSPPQGAPLLVQSPGGGWWQIIVDDSGKIDTIAVTI